jgi:hypothetical protein
MANGKRTCFVVMGFGKKTDFETGRTFDLDKSYRNLIKPAVVAAGYECVRADDIVHSGLIDVPMYEQLLAADVVVADLSTSNKNAFYELGVRHALRPYTTIVIAEDGMKPPFDVNHVVVRSYKHLGEDIGYDEVMRFRGLLTDAIATITALAQDKRVDSPVYRFVSGLKPPAIPSAVSAVRAQPEVPAAAAATSASSSTHSALMKQVNDAIDRNDFLRAKSLLGAIRTLITEEVPGRPEDPYIVQRLAFVTYKSKHPSEVAALKEASTLLASLEPETSNDTETLGLWGAVHKRLWALTQDTIHLDEAVRALERGFYLRNDYYNGINLAFLLNLRASRATDPADAITDFTLARRVRQEVLTICEKWLAENPAMATSVATEQARKQQAETRYWVLATLGEAMVGLGDPAAPQRLDAVYASAPAPWMADSTREQIGKLQALLAETPLKHLKALA